jgi:hypothetical protein
MSSFRIQKTLVAQVGLQVHHHTLPLRVGCAGFDQVQIAGFNTINHR